MQLELLEQFEMPSQITPPRSELVSLHPIGIGSAMCEALISYLTRLAGAHVVRPNVLVKNVILPLTDIRLKTATHNFNFNYSRTINSYTSYASKISASIETLTLQQNLQLLTFLPWGNLLDPKGSRLLRDHVAVCRRCLDELRDSDSGIYYPLLWYLRSVAICSKHQSRLIETCSECGHSQNFVSHHAMLGHCTRCGAWLGAREQTRQTSSASPPITIRERFMAAALEQMVENNRTAHQFATHECLIERIAKYSKAVTDGNMKAFEIRLGFQKSVVVNWRDKQSRPRIDMFLELCFRLGQLPIQFLTADIPDDLEGRIDKFKKGWSSKRRKFTQEDRDKVLRQLTAVIEGPDAPTQLAVAEKLQVKRRFLNHHFPDLFRAISEKHKRAVAARTAEKRAAKINKAKAVTQKMFDDRQSISKRKVDKALHAEGLTLADGEIRHAVKEVITTNFNRNQTNRDVS